MGERARAPHQPYAGLLAEIYEATPAQLGLGGSTGMFLPVQSGGQAVTLPRLSAESIACMDQIRRQYARTDNTVGPTYLLQLAAHHVELLEPTLFAARGHLRKEALRLCAQFAELAGWLCQRAGALSLAEQWTDMALDFTEECNDAGQRAYVLMRKSGITLERGDQARSVSLALAAARDLKSLGPRLNALVLRQQALSFAVAGDPRASKSAAARAVDSIQADGPDDELDYVSPAYVLMETGASAFHLGRHQVAAERLARAAAKWPEGFARDHGLCLARLVVVEATRGNVDVAVEVGHDAAMTCGSADSARTRAVLRSLSGLLAPYDRTDSVRALRHLLSPTD